MKQKIILPHFSIVVKKTSGLPFDLKIIVTRSVGRAVDRNRIKRVVREFFRQKRALLPWDSVVCRILPRAREAKNAELFQELGQIL